MKKENDILSLKKELVSLFGSKFTVSKNYNFLIIKFFYHFDKSRTASYIVSRNNDKIKTYCKEFFHNSEIQIANYSEKELAVEIKKDFFNMLDDYQKLIAENFSTLKKNIEGVQTEDTTDRYLMARSFNCGLSCKSFNAKIKSLEEDAMEYEISNLILENIKLSRVLLKEFIKSKHINKDVKKKAILTACSDWINAKHHDNYYWTALNYIKSGKCDMPLPEKLFNLSSNSFPSGVYPSIKSIENLSGKIDVRVIESKLPNLEEVTYMYFSSNGDEKKFLESVADSKISFMHVDIIVRKINVEMEKVIRDNMMFIEKRKINAEYSSYNKDVSMIIGRLKREAFSTMSI